MAGTTTDREPQRPILTPCPTVSLLFSGHVLPSPLRWLLSDEEQAIGRAVPGPARATAIELPEDSRLSQLHARILATPNGHLIRDEGSRNGTYVNGQLIQSQPLSDGDLIRAGDSLFLFRRGTESVSAGSSAHDDLIAESPPMCVLLRYADQVAARDRPVLLLGESGTGKEMLARYIHARSRPRTPLVAVNCATLTPELADSALFGHVRGAFTGAAVQAAGSFRAAKDGVLFLDEVGELPSVVQAKLLRAIEDGKIRPVGAHQEEPYSARIIVATNRDLAAECEQGRFRADLFYRLRSTTLTVPALRDRREDILPILLSRLPHPFRPELTRHLTETILLHEWPDNVRGVVNLAEYWLTRHSSASVLDLTNLPDWLPSRLPSTAQTVAEPGEPTAERPRDLARISRIRLREHLVQHKGNIAAVARAEGCSEKQVRRWLDHYGMNVWEWRGR